MDALCQVCETEADGGGKSTSSRIILAAESTGSQETFCDSKGEIETLTLENVRILTSVKAGSALIVCADLKIRLTASVSFHFPSIEDPTICPIP